MNKYDFVVGKNLKVRGKIIVGVPITPFHLKRRCYRP